MDVFWCHLVGEDDSAGGRSLRMADGEWPLLGPAVGVECNQAGYPAVLRLLVITYELRA